MTFRIPKKVISPYALDTIGKMLVEGAELSVCCHNNGCNRMDRVNLVSLAAKLGTDHPCMHDALKDYFHCARCKTAGKPHKNIGFILHSGRDPHCDLPPDRYPWVA